MFILKIDQEKIKKCIEVYKDQHNGEKPYIICNEKTAKLITSEKEKPKTLSSVIANNITYNIQTPIEKIEINGIKFIKNKKWDGITVFIDDELEFGEIHIG